MTKVGLNVGVRLKEIATRDNVYTDCTVLHSDAIGVVFEVKRAVAEGGTIETVVSQMLIPWSNIRHMLLMEERT
ncbi:MAG: hypothetical protein JXO72_00660 [Vicinamibacteria bacterium]|nr:hypothetical protein [Vicinamibacteria bacterium]